MKIGLRIKERRKELKMSADELGKKLGKDRSTIYRYENGDIENLPLDVLEPIAKALDTTPQYLMGWTETDFLVHVDTDILVESLQNQQNNLDKRLLMYAEKLMSLNPEHQNIIFSNIEFLLSQERGD